MSLCRTALRVAVVEALRGRTRAGVNVLDSQIGVLDIGETGPVTKEKKPFIAVYTAAGDAKEMELRSLFRNGVVSLQIEFGATAAMAVVDPETGEGSILPGIPATDEALEFTLDLIGREIANALTDPANSWAEVFRSIVVRVDRIEIETVRNADDGQRLAARQMRLHCLVADDPVPGEQGAPDSVLGPFFELAFVANERVQKLAELMSEAIGPVAKQWKVDQRRDGMTSSELLAVGRGPIERSGGATPVFADGQVDLARLP